MSVFIHNRARTHWQIVNEELHSHCDGGTNETESARREVCDIL